MPTYSYKCAECGKAFDVQQAMADAPLTECPNCGGPLRKVFGLTGISFNGSGFYRTDSRAKPGSGSGSESKPASGGGSGASGGSGSGSSGSGSSGSGSSGSGSSGSGSSGSGSKSSGSAA